MRNIPWLAIVDPLWKFEGWPPARTECIGAARGVCETMTVSPAIAAFAAAGNDIDALEKAIEEASYLDASPGEDRQKLRGEPTPFCQLVLSGEVHASGRAWEHLNTQSTLSAATRTRVKKLKKEAIAKAEAAAKDAATKGPKERSPFIKEVHERPSR